MWSRMQSQGWSLTSHFVNAKENRQEGKDSKVVIISTKDVGVYM